MLTWMEHLTSRYGVPSDDNDDDKELTDPTLAFQVFVLKEGEWKELQDLDGVGALFAGFNSAVCV